MTGVPKAYLTLRDPESNYGENYDDGARTKFSRVALDPQVGTMEAAEVRWIIHGSYTQ